MSDAEGAGSLLARKPAPAGIARLGARRPRRMLLALAAAWVIVLAPAAVAVDAALVRQIATGDNDEKAQAIRALVAAGDPAAVPLLRSLVGGGWRASGGTVLIVGEAGARDAVTGEEARSVPGDAEEIIVNNRIRRETETALGALALSSPDVGVRREAARALQGSDDAGLLPAVRRALETERDESIRQALGVVEASIALRGGERTERLAAIESLAQSTDPQIKTLLLGLLERKEGRYVEPDAEIRAATERALKAVERNLARGEWVARVFSGVSLGSVLLLVALGLAITYGLMGVINMAHGELMMLGAYGTYVTQDLFRRYLPDAFDYYLIAAVPVSFIAAALVGAALERGVIRFLYGRPLETLLATWGISLVLIQLARSVFGAQNVQVENPSWMSGGFEALTGIVLPYSRITIIAFSAVILAATWLLLSSTRLGLFVRAVTQNRPMAGCVGVPTPRVDTYAFALGSGIAGLAGCALSQIGNVGPDLGQAYIVDAFMVVVLGGVGQLAGTLYAALGLGIVNKFLEAWSGAVLAKIAVLLFVIVFIQRRPQGLFAPKGRTADA
jgi:urea transport system permease protein